MKFESSRFTLLPCLALALALLLATPPVFSAGASHDNSQAVSSCERKVDRELDLKLLKKRQSSGENSAAMTALGLHEKLSQSESASSYLQYFRPQAVYAVLADEEMPLFAQSLSRVLTTLQQKAGAGSGLSESLIRETLKEHLDDRVPDGSIASRIRSLKEGRSDSLRRALGYLSLRDVQKYMHGGDPLHPTRESLLGRYIAMTGAKTVIRRFAKGPSTGPGATNRLGEARLVVAVSERSMDAYLHYFARPELLLHVHTPGQGTLLLSHEGKAGTYASMGHSFRFPGIGTIMPHMLLSSTEGFRAARYFRLGKKNPNQAQEPWQLKGYCATGGYDSCTHWVGNIPVGDRQVPIYRFPGYVDEWASNSIYEEDSEKDKLPRAKRLKPYRHRSQLVHQVWQVPGREQLADVLGIRENNLRGELANPGWVAISLTAWTSLERVPVVFLAVENHEEKIPRDFDPEIDAH